MHQGTNRAATIALAPCRPVIRRNTRKGLSVIYISHNLGEIFDVCDRVTVMVDGRKVDTSPVKDVTMNDIVHRMIGRSTTALYARRKKPARAAAKKGAKSLAKAWWGIAAPLSMDQERGFGIRGKALGMPHRQIGLHFAGSVSRKWQEARFVKLGSPDQKGPFYWRIIAQGQVRQFTTPHRFNGQRMITRRPWMGLLVFPILQQSRQ